MLTFSISGMTHSIATSLSCHLDPSNLPSLNLSPVECEERRRAWAGLMMLYTIQSTLLGNPASSHLHLPNNVQLPTDANDVDITTQGIVRRDQWTQGPTQMSYLLFKFRLYNLASEICRAILPQDSSPLRTVIDALDWKICRVQEEYDRRYMADTQGGYSALPTEHAMHLHILHSYAHQLFLLLHRPFFFPSRSGESSTDLPSPSDFLHPNAFRTHERQGAGPNASQIRTIASAEALLDIYGVLCEESRFARYMWYTRGLGSFHALHAATVLATAMKMRCYRERWDCFRGRLVDAVGRLRRLQYRSGICKKALKVLEGLVP
jgi:hypothetical protein